MQALPDNAEAQRFIGRDAPVTASSALASSTVADHRVANGGTRVPIVHRRLNGTAVWRAGGAVASAADTGCAAFGPWLSLA